MGRAKRPLYKRPRTPARTKGVIGKMAPVALPDATTHEVTMAIFSWGKAVGVTVGRGCEYDTLRDEYTAIGKSNETGLARDFKVSGATIAQLIQITRAKVGEVMGRASIDRFIQRVGAV